MTTATITYTDDRTLPRPKRAGCPQGGSSVFFSETWRRGLAATVIEV
jgi:hypothetical protein